MDDEQNELNENRNEQQVINPDPETAALLKALKEQQDIIAAKIEALGAVEEPEPPEADFTAYFKSFQEGAK